MVHVYVDRQLLNRCLNDVEDYFETVLNVVLYKLVFHLFCFVISVRA